MTTHSSLDVCALLLWSLNLQVDGHTHAHVGRIQITLDNNQPSYAAWRNALPAHISSISCSTWKRLFSTSTRVSYSRYCTRQRQQRQGCMCTEDLRQVLH
jgi:hypothetical protein